MGAVSTFRGPPASKKVAVLVSMLAAFTLGGGSGYLVKTMSLPAIDAMRQSVASQVADRPQSDLTRVLPGEVPAGT